MAKTAKHNDHCYHVMFSFMIISLLCLEQINCYCKWSILGIPCLHGLISFLLFAQAWCPWKWGWYCSCIVSLYPSYQLWYLSLSVIQFVGFYSSCVGMGGPWCQVEQEYVGPPFSFWWFGISGWWASSHLGKRDTGYLGQVGQIWICPILLTTRFQNISIRFGKMKLGFRVVAKEGC